MKRTTREWVRKAESDYQLAKKLARGRGRFPDQRCFLCQQSAEKYLKALLEELVLLIPRTHILKDLLVLLQPHHPSLSSLRRGLGLLTRFAVGIRYPGQSASRREAEAALRWAERVRRAARALLGLRTRPPPRKK